MKENGLKIYTIFKNISACLKCFFLNFVILKKTHTIKVELYETISV